MDTNLVVIPVVLIGVAVVVMVVLNVRGKKSKGKAEDVMNEYAKAEIPSLHTSHFDVINLLEDAVNAQHIWVVAYNKEGMHLLPSTTNPFTQSIKRYSDEIPTFNWKKQIAANVMVGNKTEELDYLPFSAIRKVSIDRNKKKIEIEIGDIKKSFKFQNKDCFGANQEVTITEFLNYLEGGLI